jgi:hypothetical protein
MTPHGPNLSHWPGNRTPNAWKADLSTGICLNFARATPAAQAQFLGEVETVLNDHYDTDGFGSLLAILRPDIAFAHEELLLSAAATGDFGSFTTWRGFALDRIVARLAHHQSPVAAEFAGLRGAPASLRRYRFLLDHADEVLRHPEEFEPLYVDELRLVQEGIRAGLAGSLDRRLHAGIQLGVIRSSEPVHRMVLNTLAGSFRVLHIEVTATGPKVRYHDRTESWFELLTFRAPPRRDLRPLAARLADLEPASDGACWFADGPTEPIPELYFGPPAKQEYGKITRELHCSGLSPETIEREFCAFFGSP